MTDWHRPPVVATSNPDAGICIAQLQAEVDALKSGGGGGSQPGAGRVLGPFPFAFSTAGLNNGVTVYTPTIGDFLLDAWISVLTAWDGVTPAGDVSQFTGGETFGWIGAIKNAVPMGVADGDVISASVLSGLASPTGIANAAASTGSVQRNTPGRFLTADPVKVVVSQDGQAGGAPVGGSAGSGAVYLCVATPSLT